MKYKTEVIITAPSLNPNINVSGISSITSFIINCNQNHRYIHFQLGKGDEEKRSITWLFGILSSYLKWVKLLVINRHAQIHFNLAVDKRALIRDTPLILLAKLFQKHIIIHLHGGEYFFREKLPVWMNLLLKLSFSGNYPKIVASPLEAEQLKKKWKCGPISVLPNCIDLTQANLFQRHFNSDESPVLLFMGRISLNKGIEYIYQALACLKKEHYNFKFIMAGKGPDEQLYVQKFKELLGEDFEFEGVASGDRKTALLKRCNVFLLPSFFEGLPMALLESMSFSLVPITTDVGSIKYLIDHGKNGLLINKYSAEQISSGIKQVFKEPGYLQQLRENAREYIFRNYSPPKYFESLNKLYK